ncbi:class I SAM-dependent methyltransferase [Streptomyces sp. DSM 44915]|uniref:Class I SAM-dependent methyltransferase n=1 Tax=Streptomyces chisholmiae TaxID=3075540 RepID=A0ABU2JRN1_9ACTN|nr:class I SAM-dependent methyltransferase [Streptomyces sp. DSM 44915]MDT0267644.1 class I SAM-dependent methyltransferase [Streptomyces sp. DSM 44915]
MRATPARSTVAGYRERAAHARAEPPPPPPALLTRLLSQATHIAELPCGTGHFVDAYAQAGVELTLVDASAAMLRGAVERAAAAGLPTTGTHVRRRLIQRLGRLPGVDAVVMPNAALNQLAAQSPPAEILARVRAALAPGSHLLLQALCTRPGATDGCAFYNPAMPDGTWRTDRRLDPERAAGAAYRQRRQHHDASGDVLRIDFAYLSPAGERLHSSSVELPLLPAADLADALTATGLRLVAHLPGGPSRLTEILAAVPGGPR